MKHYFFALIFASLLLYSCGHEQNDNESDSDPLQVVVVPEQADMPIDSIIEKVDYIKLGDTGDVLIGDVSKLWITPQHIVIVDKFKAMSIFVFDRSGNAQVVINRLGRGPQEYTSLTDVCLTPDQQRIVVLDNSKKKLLYYNMEGDFLYDKNTSFWIGDLAHADEQHIIAKTYGAQNEDPGLTSYENKDDNLYILDTLMHIKQSMMPRTAILKQFEDRLYVNAIHSDTIYRVAGNDGLVPQYRLDMSAINGVTNFGEESMEKVMEIRKNNAYFPNDYVDGKDFALFRFSMPVAPYMQLVMHNKHTGQNYSIEGTSKKALNIYFMEVSYVFDDQFVAAIPAFRFVGDNAPMPGSEQRAVIQKNLTDEDNPVLLFYTLKDPE